MRVKTAGKPRLLTVENVGDRYRKMTILQIRLKGKWLLQAGYQPEQRVFIFNPEPGVLVIRSV